MKLQNMAKFALISLLSVFVMGCWSIRVEYVGEAFDPVDNVEQFFDINDIKRPYKNVGEVIAVTAENSGRSTQQMQHKMLAEARNNGADAILFGKVNTVVTSNRGGSNFYEITLKGTLLKYTD